ncbi:MAG: AEC family transporter [Desulfotignum sp.]|nr:AEC family transporter [Desulfotignum sp.]MCF8112309.1 AEC family transporter [Desulfotignum sp.]MCF8125216.1 AEC family transporter [Desulfotignum sp.]
MLILNTIFPLFALLLLGRLLKFYGMTDDRFLAMSDRLVYYIFFPAMLFWKIGGSGPDQAIDTGLFFAGLIGVILAFLASLWAIRFFHISQFQAGSFCQACFRFNTYIGMAIVMTVLGEDGVRHFGILAGIVIPVINVLSVSVLVWYSDQKLANREKVRYFIRALVSNPLIIGCAAGFLFSRSGLDFPLFVRNSFSLMTSVTLPLALISIGGSLRFRGLADHGKISLLAAGFKLVFLPVTGFVLLTLFQVTGIAFTVGMIFFALPTSTAIYVLSGQLNSDTDLAAGAIMISTLLSFVSLSLSLLI